MNLNEVITYIINNKMFTLISKTLIIIKIIFNIFILYLITNRFINFNYLQYLIIIFHGILISFVNFFRNIKFLLYDKRHILSEKSFYIYIINVTSNIVSIFVCLSQSLPLLFYYCFYYILILNIIDLFFILLYFIYLNQFIDLPNNIVNVNNEDIESQRRNIRSNITRINVRSSNRKKCPKKFIKIVKKEIICCICLDEIKVNTKIYLWHHGEPYHGCHPNCYNWNGPCPLCRK